MGDSSGDAYERRRQQVRRAQKSHRARKATYVKSLEEEVAELREQNAAYEQEAEEDRNTIRLLQSVLSSHGIEYPVGINNGRAATEQMATISLAPGRSFPKQELEARLHSSKTAKFYRNERSPRANELLLSPGNETSATGSTPDQMDTLPHSSSSNPSPSPLPDPKHFAHPRGLDSAQIGINFVLALEQPCLYHHKLPSPELLINGQIGTGHQAMLSSPIMARSPAFSLNPLKIGYPADAQWAVPADELETLLRYSQDLALEEREITPVQAWQVVRQHVAFGELGFEQLEMLRRELFPLVQCHGFGAVMDRLRVEDVMALVLRES